MQAKLEDVLKDKERELKLYQRFLDLRAFCEEKIFPGIDVPLKGHTEALKGLMEEIIPDPKDRREEMFSGEIFVLLCAVYLHDTGFIKQYEWNHNREILNSNVIPDKGLFLNYEIGRRLNIPPSAMEIINAVIYSHSIKKIPLEWEIEEDGKKAIIRNTRILMQVFNFSHVLLDAFDPGPSRLSLRRRGIVQPGLQPRGAEVDIDAREGLIRISYSAGLPHDLHVIERAKSYVQSMFESFKQQVSGRLGFQYSDIVWDIRSDFRYSPDPYDGTRFSPYNEMETPRFDRWDEASLLLDTLFALGHVAVVGEPGAGKTTVLKAFVMRELLSLASNVFYCETWKNPVNEIRYAVCRKYGRFEDSDLDIISICRKLVKDGPCTFVIDSCERLAYVEDREREKFERFVSFCLDQEDVYLVMCGDKGTFLDWCSPFPGFKMASVHEVKPIRGMQAAEAYGDEKTVFDRDEYYGPIECELMQAGLDIEKVVTDILEKVRDDGECRAVVAVMAGSKGQSLQRYALDDLFFETRVSRNWILSYLTFLQERDIVEESEYGGISYYALSSRYLRGPLVSVLKLDEFEEKGRVREVLRDAVAREAFLEEEALEMIEKWKDHMVFSREDIGCILGSLVVHWKDYSGFLEKARADGLGVDIQPILKLLYLDDAERRREAVKLLVESRDKRMINPLLEHLRQEDVPEIKKLLITGIGLAGKKRAFLAIINALREIGDRQLRLKAIDFFCSISNGKAEEFLVDIREHEKDPTVLAKIESLLASPQVSE
ncbi:MAG: hypothetical protein A4E62_02619 [Syntrophorhabdus sp. PtaU1.Bin002]|nr:MAG: hypothetical protein A4E62_02619 [Syntrophorhabdus sp. PtaU1.Bin002]